VKLPLKTIIAIVALAVGIPGAAYSVDATLPADGKIFRPDIRATWEKNPDIPQQDILYLSSGWTQAKGITVSIQS
jgi:hypothetical protein